MYSTIDLFSGAGGLSAGFRATKQFESIFAVEFERAAAQTYALNFGHELVSPQDPEQILNIDTPGIVFNGDIRKLGQLGFSADIIIGGPPCQGFSPLGKIRPRDEHHRMNQLWQEYMKVVNQVRPKAFLIENVPQILNSNEFVAISTIASRLGYRVVTGQLHAVEFGVPQNRVRAFILGILGDVDPILPNAPGVFKTVRDAIADLPLYPDTTELGPIPEQNTGEVQNLHFGRNPTSLSLKRYKLIPPGGNRFNLMNQAPEITPRCWLEKPTGSTDVFGRLMWDNPAYTIRTEFFKPEKGCYLHPEAHRPITHREAARLQTFDDHFNFVGSKTEIAKQIGNAVPPLLAQYIAKFIAVQLDQLNGFVDLRKPLSDQEFHDLLIEVINEVYGPPVQINFDNHLQVTV